MLLKVKDKHIELQTGLSLNIKTSAVVVFWVSVCILLGSPFKDTLNKRQLNNIGAWGSNMVSYDNFS